MESIACYSFSLVLRLFVSVMLPGNIKIGNVVIGLTEGAIMQYIMVDNTRQPSLQYARFAFCLLIDYVFTTCWTSPVVVILSAGVGTLLHDVVHALWKHPGSRCRRCQSRAKIQLEVPKSRRRALSSNIKAITPALMTDRNMPAPNSRVRFLGATLPTDSINVKPVHPYNLSHTPGEEVYPTPPSPSLHPDSSDEKLVHPSILSHTPNEEAYSVPPLPSPHPDQSHLAATPNSGLCFPNSAFPSCTISDGLDNPYLPLEPSIISEAAYTSGLPHTPTAGTASPVEAPTMSEEDTVGSITKQGEQQMQCPIPEAFPSTDRVFNEVVCLASDKPSSDIPAGWNDLESETSPPSSVISVSGRDDLISHAELIRHVAVEADQLCIRLKASRTRAMKEGRIKEAFLLIREIDDAEVVSRKLHERAERRYYRAHNLRTKPREIDVHGLRVREALPRVEQALRGMLLQGATDLRVIVGRGKHSVNNIPVLKSAVLKAMGRHGISAKVDPSNPGVVIITLPS